MNCNEFVGLDVAKDKFDVSIGGKLNTVFTRDQRGLTKFSKWLKANTSNPWVCMEATGIYSELIAEHLISKNIKATIANPMQIKSFCRAKLLRNKNDILDAKAILEYAKVMPLREYNVRSTAQKDLNDLNKLLDLLKGQRIQLENQLESAVGEKARKKLKKLIKEVNKKIIDVEKEMDDLVKENEDFREKFDLITSIPGVGKLTAYQILSMISDINTFKNAKEFAAFIGLSPKQNQSGKFTGNTKISKVGNPRLRKSFYMASLSAKRHNPNLQNFVARLKENGKAPKAILCAVMRKLAHLVYGVLKNKRPFIVGYNDISKATC